MTATVTRKARRKLPIDATAAGYAAKPPPAAVGSPICSTPIVADPWTLGPGWVRQWEVLRLETAAMRSEAWWLRFFAKEKVPADTHLPIVDALIDWILIEGIVRLNDPDSYQVVGGDEPTVDAEAEGLSVRPLPAEREELPPAIHPGCQRFRMIGDKGCTLLRRYGERLCPACSRDYLKLHRATA